MVAETEAPRPAAPLLVVAEFVFTQAGEAAFLPHVERTLAEVRATEGCLQAVLWTRPGRRYLFATLWSHGDAVTAWVENAFHHTVLKPGFRAWCTEGCFGEYALTADHPRARKCPHCGRWTGMLPGWDEGTPSACAKCGESLPHPEG